MTSGRKPGDINKKTAIGMADMQKLFSDKPNWISGLSRDEFISFQFKIPLRNVLSMNDKLRNSKWGEITTIRRYLRNVLHYSIEYVKVKKGTEIYNKEFGKRILKNNTNIYHRITKIEDAQVINKRFKTQANAFYRSGDNVIISAEEYEKEIPIKELLKNTYNDN